MTLAPSPEIPHEAYEASRDPENWVDHYVKLEAVGSGGMSTVWRAFDTKWRMEVALKFLHPHQDAELLAHGAREGRITAQLTHPAIPRVYQEGVHRGQRYIAMQFVRGVTLDKYRPRDAREAAEIVRTVAQAVHEAHRLGIHHRDINPQNVMVEERAGRAVPYLMDFGVAQLVDEPLTAKGIAVGKKRYMSPEQLENRIDARTDVYALGATLYFLAGGAEPFAGVAETRLDDAVRHAEPRRLPRTVPRDLASIVRVAMDKDPACRYATAAEFADALGRFLAGEDVGRRPSVARALWRRVKRHRWRLTAAAAATLAIGALGAQLRRVEERERETWVLRYDLSRDPGGAAWEIEPACGAGSAELGGGRISLVNRVSDAIVRLREPFPGDVRLEYTARIRDDSPAVCDASCFFNASATQIACGYFVGIGSERNTRAKIARANRIVAVNPAARLERGRAYRVVAERDDRGVRVSVDGAPVIRYDDALPLGEEHARVGLYARASLVDFTDVRVWVRPVPERLTKLRHADRLFAAREHAAAARLYAELAPEHPELRPLIEFRRAVALARLNRDDAERREAAETLSRLAQRRDDLRLPALRALASMRLSEGAIDKAAEAVAPALAEADVAGRYAILRAFEERFEELLDLRRWDDAVALADTVMTRFGDAAVETIGTSNYGFNLPLRWASVLAARRRADDALRLFERLYRLGVPSSAIAYRWLIVHATCRPADDTAALGDRLLADLRGVALPSELAPIAAFSKGGALVVEAPLASLLERVAQGRMTDAWREIAGWPAGHERLEEWRRFFADQVDAATLFTRLAIAGQDPDWWPEFWTAVRHDLHGRPRIYPPADALPPPLARVARERR